MLLIKTIRKTCVLFQICDNVNQCGGWYVSVYKKMVK